MAEHNDFGKEAEKVAASFLEKKGYKILLTNYRYLKSEIDIIAEFNQTIIVVEVKARSFDHLLEPHEAVTKSKIKLLVSGTNHFMEHYNRNEEVRFDIVSIILSKEKKFEINHIENAFLSIDAH